MTPNRTMNPTHELADHENSKELNMHEAMIYDEPPPPPFVLVEGPPCDSAASFLGAWLTAAAKAEGLWRKALQAADFAEKIDRLTMMYDPDFAVAACSFVMRLDMPLLTAFVVRLENEDGDEFTLMAAMGFFVHTGDHYRMAIPSLLTLAKVKAAAIAYASTETETEEDGSLLHPEQLVVTMSFENATASRERLQRCRNFAVFGGRFWSQNSTDPSS